MPPLNNIQKQAADFLGALTGKQKTMLLAAGVVTVAVVIGFASLMATPDYKPLVTGMEANDAQALGEKLAAKNIPYRLGADGKSVEVPSDKLDSSRMEVASDGMPRTGRLGFELFDKMNWGQTEFDEKVNYQRALEGELERSIKTLNDVESVRVHLVMPVQSVFLDRERAAKATVVLKLRSGRLPEDTQLGIARLVSGAVENLSAENVTVIDADTNRPLGMPKRDSISGDGTLEQELSARLVHTLEPVVGTDHVRASVNVEYDPSTSEESEESYDPDSQVAVSSQHSEEQVDGPTTGGVPGTTSNVPSGTAAPKTPVVSDDGSQVSKTENETYAVSKTVRHTLNPAGRLHRISAALVVDDVLETTSANGKETQTRRKRTAEELKNIEELAKAAIGIDAQRGDTLTVENLSFEQLPPAAAPAKLPLSDRVRVVLHDWSSIVRYAAVLLLFLLAYALLLRPLKKQVLATVRELPSRVASQAPAGNAALEDALAALPPEQRALVLKKQLVDKVKGEPAAAGQLIHAWINEEAT
ncbi:MAG: flagellar basal-body MS-ring/collar protein FliF [Terriglobales bacterium]|jgi:flagellar M-ring protein FliF